MDILTLFIQYNNEESIIQLSKNVSMGVLKQEIHQKFGIPVNDQIIEGWFRTPSNDDTILSYCCDPITLSDIVPLTVRIQSTNVEIVDNFSTTVSENEKLEMESINEFLQEIAVNLPASTIRFLSCRLTSVIEHAKIQEKIILLYLHNKYDEFASRFWQSLENEEIINLLKSQFCILGWNIEKSKYHSALHNALSEHNLDGIEQFINCKSAVALCIMPTQDSCFIYSCMNGKYTISDFLANLQNAQECFYESQQTSSNEQERENTEENVTMTSEEIQQFFAEVYADRDYNCFEHDEHDSLKRDICYALKGAPESEDGYEKLVRKTAEELYQKILSNSFSENRDQIEVAFIYNCLEPLDCKPDSIVNPVIVFVIRKCHDSEKPCRTFVDHTGRVYENWEDYKENVKLSECMMVLPYQGRYDFDKNGQVLLERIPSPACSIGAKVLKGVDVGTSVAGLASTGTLVAASVIPAVAALPFIAVPAMVTGGVVGLYAIGRSVMTVRDRKVHQETMHIKNPEARAAYLNIAAGSLGFIGSGANMVVSQLITRGVNIGTSARVLINVVNVSNLAAGGASLTNSTIDVIDHWITHKEAPSALTLLQLSSSILFFGHAVINFRTCGTLIEETQARTLQDFKDSLRSNRHRRTFDKMMKETIRRNDGSSSKGQAEIIKSLRSIQSKDEVLAVLTRANKSMNKNGIKFHAEDGQIKLNGIAIDMMEFASMNNKELTNFLANLPTAPEPTASQVSSMKCLFSTYNLQIPDANLVALYILKLFGNFGGDVRKDIINLLGQFLAKLTQPYLKTLNQMFPNCETYLKLIDVLFGFFITLTTGFENWIKEKINDSDDDEFYRKIHHYVVLGREQAENVQKIIRVTSEIMALKQHTMKKLLNHFYNWFASQVNQYELTQERTLRRRQHSARFPRKKVICKCCGGHYYINP